MRKVRSFFSVSVRRFREPPSSEGSCKRLVPRVEGRPGDSLVVGRFPSTAEGDPYALVTSNRTVAGVLASTLGIESKSFRFSFSRSWLSVRFEAFTTGRVRWLMPTLHLTKSVAEFEVKCSCSCLFHFASNMVFG